MTVSCEKEIVINVAAPPIHPDLYWTLDEASGDRIDKVKSVHLVPSVGSVITAQPGKFSNGLGFAETGAGNSNLATPLTHDLSVTSSNGWSWCFWMKINDWRDPPPAFPWSQAPIMLWARGAQMAISVVFDPKDTALSCQDGSVPHSVGFQFSDNNLNLYCGVPLTVTLGDWNFVHVFYDPATAQCGYQINAGSRVNAPQSPGPPAAPVFGALAGNSNLIFSQQWNTANTANIPVIIDEVLFKLSRVLTQTEINFLWNNSVGRSWPIA